MIDQPLTPQPARPEALSAVRAAMLAEAARPRGRGWKASAGFVAGATLGSFALIALGGLVSGAVTLDLLLRHAVAMAPVLAVCAAACVTAFVPRGGLARLTTLGLGLTAAVLLVLLRAPNALPSSSPAWVCTVSHVGVAVLPGIIALVTLRRSAFNLLRATIAGLAVGASGALLGELVCEQGPLHVLLFHLPAWTFSALAVAFISSRLTPRSFAP
jgi:hypothetical protein